MTQAGFLIAVSLLGLLIGSFLNVVIYRLPIILKKEGEDEKTPAFSKKNFNLLWPRSYCPQCKKKIPFWLNIPIFSYFFLLGKCAFCKTPISPRYPLVEILTAIASFAIAFHFGNILATFFLLPLTWALIAIVFIDLETQLLPDQITIPLIWLGLLANCFSLFIDLRSAVIGTIIAYLSLWLIANLYQIIRHQEGMGHGDFKLFAVFGAWLGFKILPAIILLASLLALVTIASLIIGRKHQYRLPFPFGPYLALAGWLMFFGRDQILILQYFF